MASKEIRRHLPTIPHEDVPFYFPPASSYLATCGTREVPTLTYCRAAPRLDPDTWSYYKSRMRPSPPLSPNKHQNQAASNIPICHARSSTVPLPLSNLNLLPFSILYRFPLSIPSLYLLRPLHLSLSRNLTPSGTHTSQYLAPGDLAINTNTPQHPTHTYLAYPS